MKSLKSLKEKLSKEEVDTAVANIAAGKIGNEEASGKAPRAKKEKAPKVVKESKGRKLWIKVPSELLPKKGAIGKLLWKTASKWQVVWDTTQEVFPYTPPQVKAGYTKGLIQFVSPTQVKELGNGEVELLVDGILIGNHLYPVFEKDMTPEEVAAYDRDALELITRAEKAAFRKQVAEEAAQKEADKAVDSAKEKVLNKVKA